MSKRFVQKPRLIALALASSLAWSSLAAAAALGEINILSARGEPLKAEIGLILASEAERNGLSVALASPEEYWNSAASSAMKGIPGLMARIQTHSDGEPYVQVTSSAPIQQDVLSLVAELDSKAGKSVRQYVFRFTNTAAPEATSVAPTESVESQQPASEQTEAASSVLVKRGDYLNKIATANKPVDVSLERMLVALYRANPEAFSGKNMNRLRAGKVLRMPTEAELAGVNQREARREIHAHVADWNAYRQQIAQHSTGYDTGYSQEGSGRIGSSVSAEEASDRVESSRDVLKLSKGDAPGSRESAAEIRSLKDKLQAAEEEVTARDKALRESRERIAMLEKNNQEMQRLLELKTQAAVPETPQAASAPVEAQASAPTATPVEQKHSVDTAEKHEAPAEAEEETKSSLAYYLGGAGLALLGIVGTVLIMRRKLKSKAKPAPVQQAKSVEEERPEVIESVIAPAEPEAVEANEVGETKTEMVEEIPALAEVESVPQEIEEAPVAEDLAEVEIELDEEVLASEPESLVEVLPEIVEEAGQSEADLEAARLAEEMEAGFAALDMPLADERVSPSEAVPEAMEFDVPSFVPELSGAVREAGESVDSGAEVIAVSEPVEETTLVSEVPQTDKEAIPVEEAATFESGTVMAEEVTAAEPVARTGSEPVVATAAKSVAVTEVMAETGSIDLDIPTIDQYAPPAEVTPMPPLPGMENVDLDLIDDTNLTEEELQARGEQWLQVATKIDLARAYQEMGDFAGAREILDEVVNEGDGEQRATAESLLQQLPAL